MTDISRRTALASAWAAPVLVATIAAPTAAASESLLPAGTLNLYSTYSQYPGTVNWGFTVTNTSGFDTPLAVTWNLGPFGFGGWVSSAWNRSGTTFTTQSAVPAGATTDTATIVFTAPAGTTGTPVATITAPGARATTWPVSITIPQ